MREINISDIPKEEAIIFKSYIPTMFKYFAPLGTLPISFFICFLIIKPEWAIPTFILGVLPFLALIVFFCISASKKTMAFVGESLIFLADNGNYYSISRDELQKYNFEQNKISMHRYYSKLFIRNLKSGKVILRLRKNIFSIKCNSLYKAEACLRSFVNGENISAKDFCYEKPAHINWEKITMTIEIILSIFICTLFATVDLILPHFKYDKVDGDMVIFVGLIPVIIFSIILLFIPSSQSIEDREYKRKNSDDSDGEFRTMMTVIYTTATIQMRTNICTTPITKTVQKKIFKNNKEHKYENIQQLRDTRLSRSKIQIAYEHLRNDNVQRYYNTRHTYFNADLVGAGA